MSNQTIEQSIASSPGLAELVHNQSASLHSQSLVIVSATALNLIIVTVFIPSVETGLEKAWWGCTEFGNGCGHGWNNILAG